LSPDSPYYLIARQADRFENFGGLWSSANVGKHQPAFHIPCRPLSPGECHCETYTGLVEPRLPRHHGWTKFFDCLAPRFPASGFVPMRPFRQRHRNTGWNTFNTTPSATYTPPVPNLELWLWLALSRPGNTGHLRRRNNSPNFFQAPHLLRGFFSVGSCISIGNTTARRVLLPAHFDPLISV